ncbi:PTS sugar transporter subunit IIA [Lactobacillus sp. YT155]|uniref:PTS sugar transporter subunit IIA n=1 Tax=Lactobacillus sp. YT155 TaxID=3060955 RepID=UPI00265D6CA9|nr:PTS sugar transporter subunit IIA [Lactobacillus sp. YT155]MDO1604922.1 PTS sugar transporter subunit IIA [Lactobacillus sp. YT155]
MIETTFSYMVHNELIDPSIDVNSEEELFEVVGKRLLDLGYVTDGYSEAVNKREKEFPTGLNADAFTMAVPHVDPEFIVKPFVYICKTKKDLDLKQMAINTDMKTKNFCFLGIKEATGQANLLKNIIFAMREEDFISRFTNAKTSKELAYVVGEYLDKKY